MVPKEGMVQIHTTQRSMYVQGKKGREKLWEPKIDVRRREML